MNKYVYGLDLSMSRTGMAIYDVDLKRFVYIDSKKTNAKQSHGERLGELRKWASNIIDKYPPFVVAIEQGFTRFNKSTQVIYRVHGVFNELFKDYEQIYYTPSRVKKDITGNGKSDKSVVAYNVLKIIPSDLSVSNDDETDAVAVAYSYLKENKLI